jgi:hypothetical protein
LKKDITANNCPKNINKNQQRNIYGDSSWGIGSALIIKVTTKIEHNRKAFPGNTFPFCVINPFCVGHFTLPASEYLTDRAETTAAGTKILPMVCELAALFKRQQKQGRINKSWFHICLKNKFITDFANKLLIFRGNTIEFWGYQSNFYSEYQAIFTLKKP